MHDAVRRSTRMFAVAVLLSRAPAAAHAGRARIVEGGSVPLPRSTRAVGKVLTRSECVPAPKSGAKVKATQRVGRILLRDTGEKSA